MQKTVSVVREVREAKQVRVSDFSGREIPDLHWSAVTKIWCQTSDHGNSTNGNIATVFMLDLMPEEMADFQSGLLDLMRSLKAKYQARNVK
ncbi:MAG: hypothetical protein IT428_16165 [Planctomycetaceae bacterium]|nr:hypothetical protein [Planctomycetaceae bacterium]